MEQAESIRHFKRSQIVYSILSALMGVVLTSGIIFGILYTSFGVGRTWGFPYFLILFLGAPLLAIAPVIGLFVPAIRWIGTFLVCCPACNSNPGNLFNHGGKCGRCGAKLIEEPVYTRRLEWLGLSADEQLRYQQEFTFRNDTRRKNSRNNQFVLLGFFVYVIFLEIAINNTFSGRLHPYEALLLIPYGLFALNWFVRHPLKRTACPKCNEPAYGKQNALLRNYFCCTCGAELIVKSNHRRWFA